MEVLFCSDDPLFPCDKEVCAGAFGVGALVSDKPQLGQKAGFCTNGILQRGQKYDCAGEMAGFAGFCVDVVGRDVGGGDGAGCPDFAASSASYRKGKSGWVLLGSKGRGSPGDCVDGKVCRAFVTLRNSLLKSATE